MQLNKFKYAGCSMNTFCFVFVHTDKRFHPSRLLSTSIVVQIKAGSVFACANVVIYVNLEAKHAQNVAIRPSPCRLYL